MVAYRRRGAGLRLWASACEVIPESAEVVALFRALMEGEGEVEAQSSRVLRSIRLVGVSVRVATSSLVDEVLPGLWLGGWTALNNEGRRLRGRGVGAVVSIVSADEPRILSGIAQLHVVCQDKPSARLDDHLSAIVGFIDDNRRRAGVYVHCGAGVSRSAAAVVAYVVWRHGLGVKDALCLVRAARPKANPNAGFRTQLESWAATCRQDTVVAPAPRKGEPVVLRCR